MAFSMLVLMVAARRDHAGVFCLVPAPETGVVLSFAVMLLLICWLRLVEEDLLVLFKVGHEEILILGRCSNMHNASAGARVNVRELCRRLRRVWITASPCLGRIGLTHGNVCLVKLA